MSQENVREAEEITGFLMELADKVNRPTSVAVITPYGAQKERVRRQLRNIGWQNGQLGPLSIEVDTVDAFQGSEADVVCYSTVRTEGSLNFILDRKRLNVACSRAKLHLLFFGDSHYLSSWRAKGKDGCNLFPKIMKHASNAKVEFRKDYLKASICNRPVNSS
jgi:superfamily I DNA and/or RNA helicase